MFITKLIKKGICIAAAAALFTASAPVLPLAIQTETEAYAAETPALPDHIMNGDFESPTVESIVGNLRNPSSSYNDSAIEAKPNAAISFTANSPWLVAAREIFEHASNNGFYWQTTAKTDRVELGTAKASGMGSYWNGTLKAEDQYGQPNPNYTTEYSAGSGDQFAELVAEEQASLYQNISTEPGSTLTWSLMHRARHHTDNSGKDTMALFIGPAQDDDLKISSNSDKDLFMYMADKIVEQYRHNYELLNTGMLGPYTVYSVEVTENTTITKDSVSTEYSDTHSQEWTCWLMTSDYMQWQTYAGNYTVPEGQEATTLAFTSLTGAINEADTYNQGNCLDNIDFGVLYPLTVNAMAGGSGTVTITTTDEGAVTSDVPEGGTFESLCAEDAAVTFTAEANDNYTFIGAYIDGVYHERSEFTPAQATYTYNGKLITMNTAHEITLMFVPDGQVTYDPNGGMFNSSNEPTSKSFNYYESQRFESSPPTLEGAEFLGWKVYTIDGEAAQNELIPEVHSIKYTIEEEWIIWPIYHEYHYWLTIYYSNDESLQLEASSDDAVLLVAQWSYGADAVACTMNFGETEYTCNSTQGGSAKISTSDNLNNGDKFTLTATANPGYSFEGWYVEQDGTESFVSNDPTYTGTFNYSESVTFHAHFSEIPLSPYLSVIAQDEKAEAALEGAGLIDHGTVEP